MIKYQLEAKDVLPNINRTQAAVKGRKMTFFVNLAQIHSVVRDIFHIHKQKSDGQRLKQNLTQFTVCGNEVTPNAAPNTGGVGKICDLNPNRHVALSDS